MLYTYIMLNAPYMQTLRIPNEL